MDDVEYLAKHMPELADQLKMLCEEELVAAIRRIDQVVGELAALAANLRLVLRELRDGKKPDFNYMTGQRPQ